jgi:hypothetical protein
MVTAFAVLMDIGIPILLAVVTRGTGWMVGLVQRSVNRKPWRLRSTNAALSAPSNNQGGDEHDIRP